MKGQGFVERNFQRVKQNHNLTKTKNKRDKKLNLIIIIIRFVDFFTRAAVIDKKKLEFFVFFFECELFFFVVLFYLGLKFSRKTKNKIINVV